MTVASASAAVLAALAIAVFPGAAAQAADDRISLSSDGITWSSALSTSLFSDFGLVVPGDVHTAELWVRNDSPESALLRVSGRDAAASSGTFGDALSLSASDSSSRGTSHSLTSIGACLQLMPDNLLRSGESRALTVAVAFTDVSGTRATTHTARVDIRTSLMDPGASDLAPTDCPPGATVPVLPPAVDPPVVDQPGVDQPGASQPGTAPSDQGGIGAIIADYLPKGVLAFTGASTYSSIMFATIALGSGGLLLLAARRRRRREQS